MVLKKHYMAFGTFNHLADGTDESEVERRYQNVYRPFLSSLYRFQNISTTMYFSGQLLNWLERKHPEFNMLLAELHGRKQIEILGGPYYYSLLPLLPQADRLGQIEQLTTALRKRFGKKPRGCWLPGYAWEPGLAATLQTCGMDYAFLPEEAFRRNPAKRPMPSITEDLGKTLVVFPVSDPIERDAEIDPIKTIRRRYEEFDAAVENDRSFTMIMFSGESLSDVWRAAGAETPDLYYEELFAMIEKNIHAMETTSPGKALKNIKKTEPLYFASWLSKSIRQNIDGNDSSPFTFNAKSILESSRASRRLYAQSHRVNLLVNQLKGDKSRKKTAQESVWKAQHLSAYASHDDSADDFSIRFSAYSSLIEAERLSRQKGGFKQGVITADLDFDGEKEFLVQSKDINVFVFSTGGSVYQIDSIQARKPLLLASNDGIPAHPSFIDSFYPPSATPQAILSMEEADCGSFSSAPYTTKDSSRDTPTLELAREGYFQVDNKKIPLSLEKRFDVGHGKVTCAISIRNKSSECVELLYASPIEIATFIRERAIELRCDDTVSGLAIPIDCDRMTIRDVKSGLCVTVSSSASLLVETKKSFSKDSFASEREGAVIPGVTTLVHAKFTLQPDQECRVTTEISVSVKPPEEAVQ